MTPDDRSLDLIRRSVLCWLATVSTEGVPNVSPKEIFAHDGAETLLIAEIASPVSLRNLRGNPMACVSMIDIFTQKGCKITGPTRILAPDTPDFDTAAAPLLALTGGAFPIRHVFEIRIDTCRPIIAPGYYMRPGTTEESQVAGAMAAYGVRPAS